VRELSRLIEQQIPLLFAFTGEQNHVFSHPDQFHDMVRPLETRGRLEVAIYPRADHTFSIPEDRRAFVNTIARWMAEKFPVSEEKGREPVPEPDVGSNTRIRHVG